MKKGDKVLFYHPVTGKEVVGIANVSKAEFSRSNGREMGRR